MSRSIGVETAVRVGSQPIRKVIHSAAADIGDVHPKTQLMFPANITGKISAIKVVFSASRIGLRSASSKGSRHDDRRRIWSHWSLESPNGLPEIATG